MDRLAEAQALAMADGESFPQNFKGTGRVVPLIAGFLLVAIELVSLLKTAIEQEKHGAP